MKMVDREYKSVAAAVRAVVRPDHNAPDMRSLAREALALLDEDLVLQAATTYLTRLARAEYNRQVREGGWESDHSGEVVNVRGADLHLGDTDESDREWLARHRENLSDALAKRALMFREFGATGPSVDARQLGTREVLDAERRAKQLEAAASALAALTDGLGSGTSTIELHIAEALADIEKRRAQIEKEIIRYEEVAMSLTAARPGFVGPAFQDTRRTIRSMTEVFGIDATDPEEANDG